MGENYLINIYSLKDKKFDSLATINFFPNIDNFNNFEIKGITLNKIILNDLDNKIVYIIDNNDMNFCLLKKTFNYYSNLTIDKGILLFDDVVKNEIQFSFIDLSDLSNKENNQLIELFNFRKGYNIPKIILNQNFETFVNVYDNNQLCIIDYIYHENINNNNNRIIEKIIPMKLIKNNSEVIPIECESSSCWDDDYKPDNLFKNKGYFCTKSNSN